MRNKDRLDSFYSDICKCHKKYFPDWRFGQLISQFFGWLYQTKGTDCFFPEEEDMLEFFKDFCKQTSPFYRE